MSLRLILVSFVTSTLGACAFLSGCASQQDAPRANRAVASLPCLGCEDRESVVGEIHPKSYLVTGIDLSSSPSRGLIILNPEGHVEANYDKGSSGFDDFGKAELMTAHLVDNIAAPTKTRAQMHFAVRWAQEGEQSLALLEVVVSDGSRDIEIPFAVADAKTLRGTANAFAPLDASQTPTLRILKTSQATTNFGSSSGGGGASVYRVRILASEY